MKKELLEHFTLLSKATYILCKKQISKDEVTLAEGMLKKFVDEYQYFYGKNAVTINIHTVKHYGNSVRNTGPLSMNSTFPFESNIGKLKKSFNCTTDVVEQIARNLSMKHARTLEITSATQMPAILRLKHQKLTRDQENILKYCDMTLDGKQKIGHEIAFKKQVFKSSLSVVTKSVDNFIHLVDNSMGSIEFFIQLEKPYAVIKTYEIVKLHGNLQQVKPSGIYKLFECQNVIKSKKN